MLIIKRRSFYVLALVGSRGEPPLPGLYCVEFFSKNTIYGWARVKKSYSLDLCLKIGFTAILIVLQLRDFGFWAFSPVCLDRI